MTLSDSKLRVKDRRWLDAFYFSQLVALKISKLRLYSINENPNVPSGLPIVAEHQFYRLY
jgi:hypothetical protein